LAKKFLKKNQLRDWIRVVSSGNEEAAGAETGDAEEETEQDQE
jgi:hypothetical protein